MKNWQIKLSLFVNYFVFAILLNSVGTVILQVQNNFGVTETDASILEACKDLSIAVVSFLVASFFNRLGYKNAMLVGLGIVTLACFAVANVQSFEATKLLFVAVGASFALIKMSVYSTIGLVTSNEKEHLGLMNYIESFFMVGIMMGGFLFAPFIDDVNKNSTSWFSAYYVLGGLSLLAFALLYTAQLDESQVKAEAPKSIGAEFSGMLRLIQKPLVLVFVSCAFIYVLMEQSIMTWLPTFNQEVLNFSTQNSVLMATILPLATALGRFGGGVLLNKIDWYKVLSVSLLIGVVLVVGILPSFPIMFPLIGLLIAPIYPAINSLIISKLPKHEHGIMSSLIIIFSALGGTLGSRVMAEVIESFGAHNAFYFSLVPIAILLVGLFYFKKLSQQNSVNN